jgi:peptidyl-dipeptidase Dcp
MLQKAMMSIVLGTAAATSAAGAAEVPASPNSTATAAAGPFAKRSTLPYELPPFGRIRDTDYVPAYEAGMADELREVAAIATEPAAATFENTIVAIERSGRLLERVERVFNNLNQSNTDPEMQKIETEMAPRLSAHNDTIRLDPVLFSRIETLYTNRAALALDPEAAQLLERYHARFVRAGARLPEADKAKLRTLNQELSTLTTQFRQNVLKATQAGAVVVDTEAELDGLPPEQVSAAQAAAERRGLTGKWLIALQNTTIQPALEHLKSRAVRERIYQASGGRGNGGTADNTALVARIVRLRAERALLLGFPTHAAYVLEDESAGTPEAVHRMLAKLAPVAVAQARREAADIQQVIDAQQKAAHRPTFTLEPWDWAYYAGQVRKARYDFDEGDVKPYFEFDRVLHDGVFFAAHELYGLSFKERSDLKVYRDDVRLFEVFDADGKPLALFLGDYFARDNKQGGAWMSSFVGQSNLFDTKPVVVNNLNFPKPAADRPVLLSFDEVTALFHEFGHALHGMLSAVTYPTLSGTAVPRDFVEYPSQYNEMWAREPSVLAHYARHYQTGASMPPVLFEKVLAAQTFGQGYATTEYIAAALLDQSWHRLTPAEAPAAEQAMAFEAAALKREGVDYPPVPPRYHTPYFSHIFAGGYSAGYYAYLWSEVLARDTGQWFHTHGGMTRANGDYLRAKILSRGRTRDPQLLFREFYGQPPDIGPLLEYRGLALPPAKQ